MTEIPRYGIGVRGLFRIDPETGECCQIDKPKKIEVAAPMVFTDEIEPLESMATPHREIFTSKSRLRRHYKEHGFRESGGDHLRTLGLKTKEEEEAEERAMREDIERAYYDVKYDRVEFSEEEKENHRREQRRWEQEGVSYRMKKPL